MADSSTVVLHTTARTILQQVFGVGGVWRGSALITFTKRGS